VRGRSQCTIKWNPDRIVDRERNTERRVEEKLKLMRTV
jgi:hypothetical protein